MRPGASLDHEEGRDASDEARGRRDARPGR